MRVPNLFLALVVIGSVSLSHSAEPLTLAAAVDRTLRSNPDLAALPARQREQNARIELAGLRPPLAFDAQIENMLGSGGYRDLDGAETSLSLSQVIEGKPAGRGAIPQVSLQPASAVRREADPAGTVRAWPRRPAVTSNWRAKSSNKSSPWNGSQPRNERRTTSSVESKLLAIPR